MQLSLMTARRAQLGLCALLAGVFLVAMASSATPEPAAPTVPQQEKPHETCTRQQAEDDDDERVVRTDEFTSNGYPYYFCRADLDDRDDCIVSQVLDGGEWHGNSQSSYSDASLCAVEGESILVECRDENNNWFDHHGAVLVPHNYEERGWGWWVQEIRYESLDETERREGRDTDGGEIEKNKNLNAQGCSLGAEPPTRDCESVRDERIEKLGEIATLRNRLVTEDLTGEERRTINARIDRLDKDVRDLADNGGIIPDDCWGTHQTSRYQVTWEAGDFSLERLMGWMATIAFSFGKMAIGTALWLLGYGFSFDVTEYLSTVSSIATTVDTELIHLGDRTNTFTLFDLAWFGLFAFAGFQILRGRLVRGGMEILVSIVLVALASVFVVTSGPGGQYQESFSVFGYADSFGELIDRSSAAMLMLASDDWDLNDDLYCEGSYDDNDNWQLNEDNCNKYLYRETNIRQLVYDNQSRVHEEFVESPYMFINWNQEFGDDGCMSAISHTLSTPYNGNGWEQRFLDRVTIGMYRVQGDTLIPVDEPVERPPNCGKMSKFNGKMDVNRMMSAIFVSIVSVTVAVLLGLVATGLIIVKFFAGLAFAILPVAVVFAVLPSRGRGLAWWWLGLIVQLWLGAMALGLMLAFMMWILDAIYSTTDGMPLAERWMMVLLLMAVLFFLRKQVMAGSQKVAQNITDRMTNVTAGGGGGMGGGAAWARPGPQAMELGKWSGDRVPGSIGRWTASAGIPLMAGAAMNAGMAVAGGALIAGTRLAGSPFRFGSRRLGENRTAKKQLRNLAHHDMKQRFRTLQEGQLGERQLLNRSFAKRNSKLDPLRQQMREGKAGEQNANRRIGAVKRQQSMLQKAFDPNNSKQIKGKELRHAARAFGMSKKEIDSWNKMTPYERTSQVSPGGARRSSVADRFTDRVTRNGQARVQREQTKSQKARLSYDKARKEYEPRNQKVTEWKQRKDRAMDRRHKLEREDFYDRARAIDTSERGMRFVRQQTRDQDAHRKYATGEEGPIIGKNRGVTEIGKEKDALANAAAERKQRVQFNRPKGDGDGGQGK